MMSYSFAMYPESYQPSNIYNFNGIGTINFTNKKKLIDRLTILDTIDKSIKEYLITDILNIVLKYIDDEQLFVLYQTGLILQQFIIPVPSYIVLEYTGKEEFIIALPKEINNTKIQVYARNYNIFRYESDISGIVYGN
jgi:hypothetical protein